MKVYFCMITADHMKVNLMQTTNLEMELKYSIKDRFMRANIYSESHTDKGVFYGLMVRDTMDNGRME